MSSSLFFGQRLCLERFKPLGKEKDEIIISGHGHTIEFYSSSQKVDTENPLKFEFELILTLDVFPCTKSLVQRIICLGNGALFCVGEKECELLLLYRHQEENLFNVNKRHSLCFDDWLVGAKCIDVTGVVLHFATNSIKFLKLDAFLNVQTKCEINFDGRALITCSLLDGDNWESLQIFAGTSLGPIYKFWPATSGEKIVQKFLGNNGMSFVIRRFQDWLFSVGDDRALRIFEKFGHGARPFALELVVKHKLILTGGVDEYLCIWRWTENIDQKMTDIILEKRIQLASLGTIQSILQISKDNFNSGFFLDLLIASRKGALVNIHLSNFELGRSHLKKLKPLFLNFIKPIPHSENITALAFGFSTNNKKHILVSGSFDRKIVCYSLEQNKVLKIHSSVQLHRSSIETIDVLRENCDLNGDIADLNDETLILSGGGRSELLSKIFELHLIFSSQLQNRDNTDVRILSVHWIFGRKFALTLCSDATLRISKLNFITKSISESSRFQLPSMAMFRAMNLGDAGSDTYCRFLFVVSSSGHLYTFKLLLNSNEPQINSIHDQFLIEKCGLSSISSVIASSSDNFLHYILIGSESGFIHLLTFDLSLRYPHINISENWHASTITALKIWNPSYVLSIVSKSIASVSLDCRLCIGNYILNENKLNCHTQICLSISDPAALIVLPKSIKNEFETKHHTTSRRNKGFNFIVSGTGIEFIGI